MSAALPPGVHGVNHARCFWTLYSEERCSTEEIAAFFGVRQERVQYVVNQFMAFHQPEQRAEEPNFQSVGVPDGNAPADAAIESRRH